MPNILRLRKGWEFDLIFRTGVRVNGRLVRLLYLRKDNTQEVRAGFAVGRRQGKAHIRSRGRRILREAFRQLYPRIIPGLDIVLGLQAKGLEAKTQDITAELEKLFMRKKLLKCFPVSQLS